MDSKIYGWDTYWNYQEMCTGINFYNLVQYHLQNVDSLDLAFLLLSSYTTLSADLFLKLLPQARFLILLLLWIYQVNIMSNFIYTVSEKTNM